MVSQDTLDSNTESTQMSSNEEGSAYLLKNDSISAKVNSSRGSIINRGVTSEPPSVKREALSPKSNAPPAYPVSVIENTMSRISESETREIQTLPDHMSLSRERQFLLPPALAASLYSQHFRNTTTRGLPWNSLIPPAIGNLQGYGLTHTLGLPQASHAMINDQRSDKQNSMTARERAARETACVTDDSSEKSSVSKRKQLGETSVSGEPLDLSQAGDDASKGADAQGRADMLLDDRMEMDCEPRESSYTEADSAQDSNEDQRKVKKEVAEESMEPLPTVRPHYQDKVLEPVRNHAPNFLSANPNALALVNHWLNFPTVLNPRAHFLPQGYGYYAPALPAANPAMAGLEPTPGLSQWVNLSMSMARAVDSLRYTALPDRGSKAERKRKSSDVVHDAETSRSKPTGADVTENAISQPADGATSNKRCKLSDSAEGLHRSVSDDSAKRRSNETDVSKTKLRRRNSAPSTAATTHADSDQEGNKKGAQVDLHSYAGCLPPHCLHLLKASGNLSLGDGIYRERAVTVNAGDITNETSHARYSAQSNSASDKRSADSSARNQKDDAGRRSYLTLNSTDPATRNPTKNITDKINVTASVPINPKVRYISPSSSTSAYLQHYLSQKPPLVLPFPPNPACYIKSYPGKRRDHSVDDDDEHIQTLQISDASSDEEDDIDEVSRPKSNAGMTGFYKRQSKAMESLGYGNGQWAELDNGALAAFGASFALSPGESHAEKRNLTVPTKMACTISKSFPQAVNGLPRFQSPLNSIKADGKKEKARLAPRADEFRPHCDVTGPAGQFSAKLIKLPGALASVSKNTSGYQPVASGRSKHSQRKLIGNIFQKSFRNPNFPGRNTSTPRCAPRLVFTSEVQREVGNAGKKGRTNASESALSKGTTSVGEVRHTEIPQTSAPEYSHKLFSFARASAAKEADNHSAGSVRSTASSSCSSSAKAVVSSAVASEKKKTSLFSSSGLPFVSAASRVRGASASSRLGSLDAKIGELRQKATERQGHKAEDSKDSCADADKMQTASDSMQFAERPSPPLESRFRSAGSPFYDNDVGRFGKRNIAVIKPNQSVLEKKTPESNCPPKKRHMKRYSPEFYSKPKVDSCVQDREVKSASPIPPPPFVSTNVLINNDDHSVNVQWCSPERNPRRKPHGSKSTTIFTLQALRGANSHTVTLERNATKYPRYRPGAVIVVESPMACVATMDERDQRLEIEDLEISDDEGQTQ